MTSALHATRLPFVGLSIAALVTALFSYGCAPMGNVSMPREVRDSLSRIGLIIVQSTPQVRGQLATESIGYGSSGRLETKVEPIGPTGTAAGFAHGKAQLAAALASTGLDENAVHELVARTMVGPSSRTREAEIVLLDQRATSIVLDESLGTHEKLRQIAGLTDPPIDALLVVQIEHLVIASAGAVFDCSGTYCGYSIVTGTMWVVSTGKGVFRSILVFDKTNVDAGLADHYRTNYRGFVETSARSLREEVLGKN